MGERAKIILNEYTAGELIKRDTLDLDKFYTTDLKLLIEVAKKEIERLTSNYEEAVEDNDRLNNIINELEKWLIEQSEKVWDDNNYLDDVLDKLKELKDSDVK